MTADVLERELRRTVRIFQAVLLLAALLIIALVCLPIARTIRAASSSPPCPCAERAP